jgi:hypothetical protein
VNAQVKENRFTLVIMDTVLPFNRSTNLRLGFLLMVFPKAFALVASECLDPSREPATERILYSGRRVIQFCSNAKITPCSEAQKS